MAHPSAEFRDPHGANLADTRSRDAQDRFFKGSASPRRRRHGAATKWRALRLDVRGLLGPFFLEISIAAPPPWGCHQVAADETRMCGAGDPRTFYFFSRDQQRRAAATGLPPYGRR